MSKNDVFDDLGNAIQHLGLQSAVFLGEKSAVKRFKRFITCDEIGEKKEKRNCFPQRKLNCYFSSEDFKTRLLIKTSG